MGKLQNNQSGFGAIETLLFLVIVGIIGFTGWYVWNTRINTDKNLTLSNSAAPVIKKTTPTTNSTAVAASYLTIKEWGVKIPVDNGLKDLVYTVHTYSDGQNIGFTLSSLKNTQCNSDDSIGYMVRFTASDVDPVTGSKVISEYPGAPQIGAYYYAAGLPQAACTDDTATQAIVSNARLPFTNAVKAVQKA